MPGPKVTVQVEDPTSGQRPIVTVSISCPTCRRSFVVGTCDLDLSIEIEILFREIWEEFHACS